MQTCAHTDAHNQSYAHCTYHTDIHMHTLVPHTHPSGAAVETGEGLKATREWTGHPDNCRDFLRLENPAQRPGWFTGTEWETEWGWGDTSLPSG